MPNKVNDAQLVHESVLSVDHYLRNLDAGITTVMLLDVRNKFEAQEHVKAFSDRLTNINVDQPSALYAYCLRDAKPTSQLYLDILNLINTDDIENFSPILN